MTEKITVPDELLEAFDQAVDKYPDSERRQVLGYPAAYLNGNLVCGLHEDSMVLRLSERDRELFLQIDGARPFVTETQASEGDSASADAGDGDATDDDGQGDANASDNRKEQQKAEQDMSEYVVPPASLVSDEAELDRWLGKAFTFVSTLPDGPRRGRSQGNSRGNSVSGNQQGQNNNNRRRSNSNNRNQHRKKTSKRSASGSSGSRKKTTRKTGGRRNNRNRQSGQAQ